MALIADFLGWDRGLESLWEFEYYKPSQNLWLAFRSAGNIVSIFLNLLRFHRFHPSQGNNDDKPLWKYLCFNMEVNAFIQVTSISLSIRLRRLELYQQILVRFQLPLLRLYSDLCFQSFWKAYQWTLIVQQWRINHNNELKWICKCEHEWITFQPHNTYLTYFNF